MFLLENEINEQKYTLFNTIKSIKNNINQACELISSKNPIFIIGNGISYHSALFLTAMLDTLSIDSRPVQSSQLKYIINNSTYNCGVVIAFSQSGESVDLIDAIESLNGRNFSVIGITNSEKSKLTELTGVSLFLNTGEERAVTATKSFTASLVASMAIRDTIKNTETNIDGIENSINGILNNPKIEDISKNISNNTIVLGDNNNYVIALERALKLRKEILVMVYSQLIERPSINKMEEWLSYTDMLDILKINNISTSKLYDAPDELNNMDFSKIENKLSNIFSDIDGNNAVIIDITDTYFDGNSIDGLPGRGKEEKVKKLMQIALAVTSVNGFPLFHKIYNGNISGKRIFLHHCYCELHSYSN